MFCLFVCVVPSSPPSPTPLSPLAFIQLGKNKVGTELRKLFGRTHVDASVTGSSGSGPSGSGPSTSAAHTGTDSLLVRAEVLSKQLKNRKKFSTRKDKRRSQFSVKELQKGLVVIDFQGDVTSNLSLSEEERLYDGSIRYTSTMSETDMKKPPRKMISTHE